MTEPTQKDDAWIEAIAQNYKRESASPFELNTMEAKIRRELEPNAKAKPSRLPAFAAVFSLLLLISAIIAQTQTSEDSSQKLVSADSAEPMIQLFADYDSESDHETYLPDDYITISQVMFD